MLSDATCLASAYLRFIIDLRSAISPTRSKTSTASGCRGRSRSSAWQNRRAMGLLKRIFGGGGSGSGSSSTSAPADPVDVDAAERAYELELARAEQDRLDELSQRQLRYADYSWQPPKQGGD